MISLNFPRIVVAGLALIFFVLAIVVLITQGDPTPTPVNVTVVTGASTIGVDEDDIAVITVLGKLDFRAGFAISTQSSDEVIITIVVTEASLADDNVWVGGAGGLGVATSLVNCVDSGGNHLNYTAATNTLSCGTTGDGTGIDGSTITVDEQGLEVLAALGGLDFLQGFDVATAIGDQALVSIDLTEASLVDDNFWVGGVGGLAVVTAIVNCTDSGGQHLNYTTATNTLSCGTSGDGTGIDGATITVDEQGLEILASLTRLDFLQGFDIATAAIDEALVSLDITEASLADDSFWLGAAGGLAVVTSIVDCVDTGGQHLNYTASSNTLSCGTSGDGGGGATITIDEEGIEVLASLIQIDFLQGFDVSTAAADEAIISLDILEASLSDDSLWLGASSGLAVAVAIVNCTDSGGQHLNYTSATNTLSCGTSGDGTGIDGSTITIDEDGIEILASLVQINFLQGFDVATSAIDEAILSLDITEASLTDDSFWLGGSSGLAVITAIVNCATTGEVLRYATGSNSFSCGTLADGDIPNSITIDLADLATALATNGGNCSVGESALGVSASGVAEGCFNVLLAVKEGGGTLTTDAQRIDFLAGFDLTDIPTGEVNVSLDLTELSLVDDSILVGSSGGLIAVIALSNCTDSGGNHLNYTASSNSFSCGTSSSLVDGPYITISGSTISADAELFEHTATFNLLNPATTSADVMHLFRNTITIDQVDCWSSVIGVSTTINFFYRATSPSDGGVQVITSNLTCGIGVIASTTTLDVTSIGAGDVLALSIISTSGTPDSVAATIYFTVDD